MQTYAEWQFGDRGLGGFTPRRKSRGGFAAAGNVSARSTARGSRRPGGPSLPAPTGRPDSSRAGRCGPESGDEFFQDGHVQLQGPLGGDPGGGQHFAEVGHLGGEVADPRDPLGPQQFAVVRDERLRQIERHVPGGAYRSGEAIFELGTLGRRGSRAGFSRISRSAITSRCCSSRCWASGVPGGVAGARPAGRRFSRWS